MGEGTETLGSRVWSGSWEKQAQWGGGGTGNRVALRRGHWGETAPNPHPREMSLHPSHQHSPLLTCFQAGSTSEHKLCRPERTGLGLGATRPLTCGHCLCLSLGPPQRKGHQTPSQKPSRHFWPSSPSPTARPQSPGLTSLPPQISLMGTAVWPHSLWHHLLPRAPHHSLFTALKPQPTTVIMTPGFQALRTCQELCSAPYNSVSFDPHDFPMLEGYLFL